VAVQQQRNKWYNTMVLVAVVAVKNKWNNLKLRVVVVAVEKDETRGKRQNIGW
jgi:hypothetical protein